MDPNGNPLCLHAWQVLLHTAFVLHDRGLRSADGRFTPQNAQRVADLLTELQSCEYLEQYADVIRQDIAALAADPTLSADKLKFDVIRKDESIMHIMEESGEVIRVAQPLSFC